MNSPFQLMLSVWFGVYLVRLLPPLIFPPLSMEVFLLVMGSLGVWCIGCVWGWNLLPANTRLLRTVYWHAGVTRSYYCILAVTMLWLVLATIDITQKGIEALWSVEVATGLRLEEGRDASRDIGGGFLSIIVTMLSGITIYFACYAYYFRSYLTEVQTKAAYLLFGLGILFSLSGGGRFTSVVAIVILFLFIWQCARIEGIVHGSRPSLIRIVKGHISFRLVVIATALITVFSQIFFARILGDTVTYGLIVSYLSSGALGDTNVGAYWLDMMRSSDIAPPLIFLISLFQYYVGHSFDQLGVLLASEYPTSGPYYLAYQMYPFAALLSKFGVSIIGIKQILSEIPNPGVYFSLIGAFYLDFGYFGGLVAGFLFFFFGSFFAAYSIRNPSFVKIFAASMFWIIVLFSPIISMLGTAVFPSLIFLLPVVSVMQPGGRRSAY